MVDAELIRKAAEAMWHTGLRIGASTPPFESLHQNYKEKYLREAEAALQVFYEHTRGQTRERKPPPCADCGAGMTPALSGWKCGQCGASSRSV